MSTKAYLLILAPLMVSIALAFQYFRQSVNNPIVVLLIVALSFISSILAYKKYHSSIKTEKLFIGILAIVGFTLGAYFIFILLIKGVFSNIFFF